MAAQAFPLHKMTDSNGRAALIPERLSLIRSITKDERPGLPKRGEHRWHAGELAALSLHRCTHCRGTGARPTWGNRMRPCGCVYRRIFRACYDEYRKCREGATKWQVSYEPWQDSDGRTTATYGMPREEFVCDFELVAKRALPGRQYRIFQLHVLAAADWKTCGRKLQIDRGTFFHEVYRIEETLGWAYAELKPYGLFPVGEYFRSHGAKLQVQGERNPWPWAA